MRTLSSIRPLHRAIVVVDVEGSTKRNNTAKARLRHVMYELLEQALRESGIPERHHDQLVDRGDGVLVLIHPVDEVPKTLLFTTFIPMLSELLAKHNGPRSSDLFRMRAAVHAGEVHFDQKGPFGEAIDIACRLVDAPELKSKLRKTEAPLVLVTSNDLYKSVVRHGYEGIDERAFEPLVHLEVAGARQSGWVCLPDEALRMINGPAA